MCRNHLLCDPYRGPARAFAWFRARCAEISMNQKYRGLIAMLTLCNTVVLAIHYYGEPAELTRFRFIANAVFAILFGIDFIIQSMYAAYRTSH